MRGLIGCVGLIFGLFVIVFFGSVIWNVMMYNDCREAGNAAYQCSAMLSGDKHYLAVDNLGDK